MSHTGLYSGLYAKVRDYAELLDHVIIRLKCGDSSPDDQRRQRLAKLLVAIERSPQADFSTQLLSALVRDREGEVAGRWSELGEALLSHDVEKPVIDRLERLARQIESERAGMLSAMRGRAE